MLVHLCDSTERANNIFESFGKYNTISKINSWYKLFYRRTFFFFSLFFTIIGTKQPLFRLYPY